MKEDGSSVQLSFSLSFSFWFFCCWILTEFCWNTWYQKQSPNLYKPVRHCFRKHVFRLLLLQVIQNILMSYLISLYDFLILPCCTQLTLVWNISALEELCLSKLGGMTMEYILKFISKIDFEDFKNKPSDVSKQPSWKINGFLRSPKTALKDFLEMNHISPHTPHDSYSSSPVCFIILIKRSSNP